jgi:hypothetical protein
MFVIFLSTPNASEQAQSTPGPFFVKAANLVVGLIYSPEKLEQLIASHGSDPIPRHIADAVRDRTPIVVMWSIPESPYSTPIPRPYRITILDPNRNEQEYGNPSWSEPLWTLQDAAGLNRLDTATQFRDVGATAAFRMEAFVPGRKIVIHSDGRTKDDRPEHHSRAGFFDWDPHHHRR